MSPGTLFVAGMSTVILALGVGFGGALLLTSTKPVHKEPPAAFAKRDQPIEVQAPEPVTAQPPVKGPAVVVTPMASPDPNDLMVGLTPLITGSPIPKTQEFIRALSQDPPAAVVPPSDGEARLCAADVFCVFALNIGSPALKRSLRFRSWAGCSGAEIGTIVNS